MLRIVALAFLMLLSACARPQFQYDIPTPAAATELPGQRSVSLFYATDRIRGPDRSLEVADRIGDRILVPSFTDERSELLTLGFLTVQIPPERDRGGVSSGTELDAYFGRIKLRVIDLDRDMFIGKITQMTPDEWRTKIGGTAKSSEGEAIIFVHGFRNSFDDAVYRAAQIKFDLGIRAPVVVYAWPTFGVVEAYVRDRNSALITRENLLSVIDLLHEDSNIKRVNILAHSMGSMVVTEALSLYGRRPDARKLGQVILAAPDVPQDHLLKNIKFIAPVVSGLAIYASSEDYAIKASRRLTYASFFEVTEKEDRIAGDVCCGSFGVPISIKIPNGEIIDISKADPGIGGLGHTRFADSIPISDDIARVLRIPTRSQRPTPAERGLKARLVQPSGREPYWVFDPSSRP